MAHNETEYKFNYNKHGITDKPESYKGLIELQNLYYTLQMRLKLSRMPSFIPEGGHLISDIEREWIKLSVVEKDFEDWLFPLIELLGLFPRLLNSFYGGGQSIKNWLKSNYKTLNLGVKPMLNMDLAVKYVRLRDCLGDKLLMKNILNEISARRLNELREQIQTQKKMQTIKEEFKSSVVEANDWIKNMTREVNKLQLLDPDKLDGELDFLAKCGNEVAGFESRINDVEKNYQKLVETKMFEARNIGYCVQKLKMDYGKLRSYISSIHREIETQRHSRIASAKISQENITEYKNSFAYFDKDDDKRLNCDEFKSCLISLGCNTVVVENDQAFDELWRQLDKGDVGFVTFQVFFQYMIELNRQANENLTSCFRVLANGKSYITKQVLIDNLGEETAEYCMSNMKPYEYPTAEPESFDYSDFLKNTLKYNNYDYLN